MNTVFIHWLVAIAFALTVQTAHASPAARGNKQPTDAAFIALMNSAWERDMRDSPEWATSVGDHRFDDKLSDASAAAQERRRTHERDLLAKLQATKPAALSPVQRLNHALLLDRMQLAVAAHAHRGLDHLSLTAMGGVHTELAQIVQVMPQATERDWRNIIARYKAYPLRVDQEVAHLREGMRLGWVTFKASMDRVPAQIDGQLLKPGQAAAEHPLMKPFAKAPAAIQAEAAAAFEGTQAALRKLLVFLQTEYIPKSPASGAMSGYPGGSAAYEFRVAQQTTTRMKAAEIHAIGQREVARLRAQMEATMAQAGFKGSFAEFVKFLNTDPQFFYTNGNDLLTGYRDIAKRVEPELPKLFAQLPRLPYGIRPIPEHEGRDQPEYYSSGSADGTRSGYFNANVLALARRPKWEMEALFVHEAVPGHHLQTARALELGDLPMFRRTAWYVAYGEGWALYAESLGKDLGLYTDPYSEFGRLRMEIWRAARLVVDTGIHSMGWSREQAIDWMTERAGIDRDDVSSEVDRYFVWPGQALGYMIGKLKIEALRDEAKAALGPRFSIRDFHMQLLDSGAVPLTVLEARVKEWTQRTLNTKRVP
jgi:uncharacterized protein (DUF885 family)